MPLAKGCSPKTLRRNISKMIREGYPRKQAVAAAYSTQRRNCSCRAVRGPKGGKTIACKARRRR